MMGKTSAVGYSASDAALSTLEDQVRREEFESRRNEARFVREVWEGRFEHHVTSTLAARFHRNTFEKLQLDQGVVVTNELLRDIVNKVAVGWSEGADYRKAGPDGAPLPEDAEKALAAELEVMDLDCLARELERDWFMFRRTFTMPVVVFDERIGQRVFEWRIYTPEKFDLVVDPRNTTRWIGVALYDEVKDDNGKTCTQATVWTRETWTVYRQQSSTRWFVVGKPNKNPYSCIPGCLGGATDSPFSLWGDADGLRLANQTVDVNAWETYKRLLAAGFLKTIMVGSTEDKSFPSGQYLRHGGVLQHGTESVTEVADFTVDLNAFDAAQIQTPRASAAVAMGLAADEFRQGNAAESGTALQMRYWARDRQALKRRPRLAAHIQELYRVGWWVLFVEMARPELAPVYGLKQLSPYAPPFDGEGPAWSGKDLRLLVNPRDLRYPETQTEAAARITQDLELGLSTAVEEMMRRDPDLTFEAAEERVRNNKVITNRLSNPGRLSLEAIMGKRGAPEAKKPAGPGLQQPQANAGKADTETELDTEAEGPGE